MLDRCRVRFVSRFLLASVERDGYKISATIDGMQTRIKTNQLYIPFQLFYLFYEISDINQFLVSITYNGTKSVMHFSVECKKKKEKEKKKNINKHSLKVVMKGRKEER